MPLKKYSEKRNFDLSPEPLSKEKNSLGFLKFCVQKHAASHLHYDFRLEHQGVLLSWAIPKGPSLNPKDKRLAVQVEDHPLDYADFEGVIKYGYGAGTVMVWDIGSYLGTNCQTLAETEKSFALGLKNGHLQFVLDGYKLKGQFSLIQLKNTKQKNNWLLIKKVDLFSKNFEVITLDYSVLTKRSLEEIAEQG